VNKRCLLRTSVIQQIISSYLMSFYTSSTVWQRDYDNKTVIFISAPVSSPQSTTTPSYASGR